MGRRRPSSFVIDSPLPIEVCEGALARLVAKQPLSGPSGRRRTVRAALGSVGGGRASIRLADPTPMAAKRVLRIELLPRGGATQLRCRLGMSKTWRGFRLAGLLLATGLPISIVLLGTQPPTADDTLQSSLFDIGIIGILVWAIAGLHRWMARWQDEPLIEMASGAAGLVLEQPEAGGEADDDDA